MRWMPLDRFDDRSIPKLHNLKRASRAGFAVPETAWALASDLEADPPDRLPDGVPDAPCIVRSGSPTEDTHATSNAGQLLSVVVHEPGEFAEAARRVVAALPRSEDRPLGVVFVQPLIRGETAGVTFFDGFYYEETSAPGSNAELTQGLARGDVRRGHVRRGDAHDAWLVRLQETFGGTIDVEWAIPHAWDGPPMLLQVRPALFPITRNETLSLANHKEILGDPPSPWMVGAVVEAGRSVMDTFAEIDPEIATWNEPYAIELAERAWLNLSAFFRMLDRWGMPRSMVTEGFGGAADGPLDARAMPLRILRALPSLTRKALREGVGLFTLGRSLRRIGAVIDEARTLPELYGATVRSLGIAVRAALPIGSALLVASRLRRPIGLASAASSRVVTHAMMTEYAALAARPDLDDRLAGLDAWLARYGHRGPLESDPARPRFAELRATLRADLARGPAPAPAPQARPRLAWLTRPLFLFDEVRERLRDSLMHPWQTLRARILDEAAKAVAADHLDDPADVFFLRGDDLSADPSTWRARVADRRSRVEAARLLDLPATASRDAIETILLGARHADDPSSSREFRGIGLGNKVVVGTAVRRANLADLLDGRPLPDVPILVAPTLEPSWAVVFPKFAAVVVELGGELSHASILLREAGIPALLNAPGAFRSIADGASLRVDPAAGVVRVDANEDAPSPDAGGATPEGTGP